MGLCSRFLRGVPLGLLQSHEVETALMTTRRIESRSRASPERVKPSGASKPSYLVKARISPPLPRSQDPMPDDLSSPTLKADFLSWTLCNLCRDWKEGARTWVNLHINLYMFEPGKYLCAHPRCLAAASVSADTALPERYCCCCNAICHSQMEAI